MKFGPHTKHAKFASTIRALAGENAGWPFLCDGSPYDCEIFLVGINPVADVALWEYWSDDAGVNKEAWLQAYSKGRKLTPTRERIERLVEAARPARVLETNIYHHCSPNELALTPDQKGTDVFDFLLLEIRPKIVFIHSDSAVFCLESKTATKFVRGQFTSATFHDVKFDVMPHRHLSRRCSYEYAAQLGTRREII